jgi:hypothetical protein
MTSSRNKAMKLMTVFSSVLLCASCREGENAWPEKQEKPAQAQSVVKPAPSAQPELALPPVPTGPGNVMLMRDGAKECTCKCEEDCVCKLVREQEGCGCTRKGTGDPCSCSCEGGGEKGRYTSIPVPNQPGMITSHDPGAPPGETGP